LTNQLPLCIVANKIILFATIWPEASGTKEAVMSQLNGDHRMGTARILHPRPSDSLPPRDRPSSKKASRVWGAQATTRGGWEARAVVSGFAATVVMTGILALAYAAARSLGSPSPEASALSRWLWGLAHNPVTERTQTALPLAVGLHFIAGVAWAVVFAGWAQPHSRGSGWRRGVVFSLGPWAFSLLVFLPSVGGGPLGLDLNAGPLPIVGNLILHLAYGAVLGAVYGAEGFQTESGRAENLGDLELRADGERAMAFGIVAGLVGGGALGWLGNTVFALVGGPLGAAILGAVGGSLVGALVGSFPPMSSSSSGGGEARVTTEAGVEGGDRPKPRAAAREDDVEELDRLLPSP
jgi:hypothetical protein